MSSPEQVKSVGIFGSGIAVPRTASPNQKLIDDNNLAKLHGTTTEIIIKMSGIENRYFCEEDEDIGTLGTTAIVEAMKDAGEPVGTEIGRICLGTATSHTFEQIGGSHTALQELVSAEGYPVRDSSEVDHACAGFTEQLINAYYHIHNGRSDNAVVVGAETLSRAIDKQDKKTGILFGDAASALFLKQSSERPDSGLLGIAEWVDGSGRRQTFQKPGGFIEMPENEALYEGSVEALIEGSLVALAMAELELSQIDLVVPHQANIRIINTAIKRLARRAKLSTEDAAALRDRVVTVVDRYGNTSTASKGLAFYHAKQEGRVKPGDNVLFADVGVGYSIRAAVVEV